MATVRASTDASGNLANADSFFGVISGNGRYVAFASLATNLVPNDTNGLLDVFVKDLQTGAIERVSVATDGTQGTHSSGGNGVDISDDGQVVVFTSHASLVPGDTNECAMPDAGPGTCQDIYVHDRATHQTTRVNVSTGGEQANNHTEMPSVSGNGRFVIFVSHANNLVPADTNARADIFVRGRTTGATTRVSVTSSGAQADEESLFPEISADGSVVAFESGATNLSTEADLLPCSPTLRCLRPFVRVLATGVTARVPIDPSLVPPAMRFNSVPLAGIRMDDAGRWIAVAIGEPFSARISSAASIILVDRESRQNLSVARRSAGVQQRPLLSGDGRVLIVSLVGLPFPPSPQNVLFDRLTGIRGATDLIPNSLSFNGQRGTLMKTDPAQPGQTQGTQHVYLYDRDADRDTIDDAWETTFGLDPTTDADAAADPDGDGLSSLQEYQAGTHPKGTAKRFFAEGASNGFFTTKVALLNPTETAAAVLLRLLGEGGTATSIVETVPARARRTVDLGLTANIPEFNFSAVVESDQAIVADRTMTWDATGFGSHTEASIAAPATTWYLAEGATHGAFDLFYLLQNPNPFPAGVTIQYLRQFDTPVTKRYTVAANGRLTIPVDGEGPELAEVEVSAKIDADLPIVVERAMYTSARGVPFIGGHGGAGITTPSEHWFLAEGATGSFFDTFLLIANPNTTDAQLRVTYLLPDGAPIEKTYTAPAQTRLTISVEQEHATLLAGTAVAMKVDVLNGQPVVAERAMWWPEQPWYEGHLSAGAPSSGTQWALAEGEDSASAGIETYILVANTGSTDGQATVTYLIEPRPSAFGPLPEPVVETIELRANSRVTLRPTLRPELHENRFSTIVQSDGVPIVVERAMYRTVNGLLWSAGTDALATKLQ